jgi:hypothetical protein
MILISPSSTFLTYMAVFHFHLQVYCVFIAQLIQYARAYSTYDQFLIRGSQLANKLMKQRLLHCPLQAAFLKFYGCFNGLVCRYNLPLGQMLPDVFHTSHEDVLDTLILIVYLDLERLMVGVTGRQGCLLLLGICPCLWCILGSMFAPIL